MIEDRHEFCAWLKTEDKSEMTIQGYAQAVQSFARWFAGTNGETLSPERMTPLDLREYRQYLMLTRRHKASTINVLLAGIQTYAQNGIASGKIQRSHQLCNIKTVRGFSPWEWGDVGGE